MFAEAEINNPTNILNYPANPRLDNPDVSFPENWKGGLVVDPEGKVNSRFYVWVEQTQIPVYGTGFRAVEVAPTKKDGKWYQTWKTELLPKAELRAAVKERRLKAEAVGVLVDKVRYNADDKALTRLNSIMFEIMLQPAQNLKDWSVDFTTYDNVAVTLNADQFKKVFLAVRNHQQHAMERQQELLAAIDSGSDEEISKLEFGKGWPA